MQHTIRIPYRLGDMSDILDLSLTFNPSAYSIRLFSSFGFSDHALTSVSSPFPASEPTETGVTPLLMGGPVEVLLLLDMECLLLPCYRPISVQSA